MYKEIILVDGKEPTLLNTDTILYIENISDIKYGKDIVAKLVLNKSLTYYLNQSKLNDIVSAIEVLDNFAQITFGWFNLDNIFFLSDSKIDYIKFQDANYDLDITDTDIKALKSIAETYNRESSGGSGSDVTKAYVDAGLNKKQNKLIAGLNITIDNTDVNNPIISGNDVTKAYVDNADNAIKTYVDNSDNSTKTQTMEYTNQSIQYASQSVYEAAKAYTDSLVKEYETVSLYLKPSNIMNLDKPTGTATSISKNLTTAESLIGTFNYTIPNAGVVLKDNLYDLDLYFTSISTGRVTYIRTEYIVNGNLIFNITTAFNNTPADVELVRQIINQRNTDLAFTANSIATLNIYGRVSSGNDTINLLINGVDNPSGLYRNAPIANLSANLITATKGLEVKTQQQINNELFAAIEELRSRL